MNLNPLSLLEKAINEHGSASILKDRIELVKDMLSKVEKEKTDLEKELSKAREEIKELKKQLPSSNFVEYMGAKFKHKPSGGYESTVYCPVCEVGMATIGNRMPFTCGKCRALTSFHGSDLQKILREVLIEYP